jgi:uncharacterized protein (TIGR02301 family)
MTQMTHVTSRVWLGAAPVVAAAMMVGLSSAPLQATMQMPIELAQAAPGDAAPVYEPQLLRLSELLGALAYLQDLCGHHQGDTWRAKMTALLDAEAKTPLRKERLAGAFNRGFQGYALTYRVCTPNAQAIISRFLAESSEIAHDVAHRYGPS